ncbi:small multi-drug export protein [Alkalihalobacillus sp. LMS39]|uniref:small multi-drug export protein n=1 Tax=Alkalihalobacillus sp. LMS39 TaxID=2924032 RepID=UPI001FB1ED4D|nr:small multi-drug export protein [Alkalihalobacillus sp. LMS39]UOE95030.1 small multi-drug export protein [Alkalihalobacillus sp. LMS39]
MNFVDTLWAYVLVFLLAAAPFFEAYGVIPLALIAGLSPIPVIILGLAGNIFTVYLVILFINKIKEWRKKKKGDDEEKAPTKRTIRAQKLWNKYGLPGLAMIGPLVVGSHLTAFMSLTFGGTKRKTAYWMTASIVIWSITFAILIHFGIDLLGFENRNYFD